MARGHSADPREVKQELAASSSGLVKNEPVTFAQRLATWPKLLPPMARVPSARVS